MRYSNSATRSMINLLLLLAILLAGMAVTFSPVQAREPGEDGALASGLAPEGLGQIGDFIFVDIDGDGIQDGNEQTGVGNVPIFLQSLETGEMISVFSSPTGYYAASVLPGTWEVSVPENLPGRRRSTAPITVIVEPGDVVNDVDFGYVAPTDVTLASFAVERVTGANKVQWGTIVEARLDGFKIWRAEDGEYQYLPVSGVIPATNSPTGASYAWLDVNIEEGVDYWYMLQSLPDEQMFGPVFVGAQTQQSSSNERVFLPLFIR